MINLSKMLTTNEWIILNDIIYNIYATNHYSQTQYSFLEQADLLIPSAGSCFFLADDTGDGLLSYPVGHNQLNQADLEHYLVNGQQLDYAKDLMQASKSMIYRETDYWNDAVREQNEYYKIFYKPKNFHYCVQVFLSHNNEFVGVISLYNDKRSGDFLDKDTFILELLMNHVSSHIYRLKNTGVGDTKAGGVCRQSILDIADRYNLTKRETDVFHLIVENNTNEEISEALFISINTLKKHIANIYKKTEATSRVHLLKLLKPE